MIGFFGPPPCLSRGQVKVRPKAGYTLDVASAIQASLADYTNGVLIGGNQELASVYPAANLEGDARASTFEVVGLQASRRNGGSDAYGDVQAAFNEAPTCDPSDVQITTVTA